MRRIHSAASASSTRPDDEADPSDTGVDQRGDRTRVDQRREREVPERRRAHDDRGQPGLRRQRSGLGHRVEAMPQRRRQARRWRRPRVHPWSLATASAPAAARTPGNVVVGRPSGERVGERQPELRARAHPSEVGRHRTGAASARRVDAPRRRCPRRGARPRPARVRPADPAANAPLAAGTSEDQRDRPGGQHRRGPPSTGEDRGRARRRGARPRLAAMHQYSTASSGVHGTSASRSATTNRARSAFRDPPPRPRTERPRSVRDRGAATRGDQPRAREWPHDHEHEGQHGGSHLGSTAAPRRARARRRGAAAGRRARARSARADRRVARTAAARRRGGDRRPRRSPRPGGLRRDRGRRTPPRRCSTPTCARTAASGSPESASSTRVSSRASASAGPLAWMVDIEPS